MYRLRSLHISSKCPVELKLERNMVIFPFDDFIDLKHRFVFINTVIDVIFRQYLQYMPHLQLQPHR